MVLPTLACVLAALSVETRPARMVLGKDLNADVVVTGSEAGPSARVEISVSVGRVGPVSRAADGSFHASYQPPTEHLPQVALIEARVEGGGAPGFAALPLDARAEVKLETKPRATLVFTLAGKDYGPLRAGRDGKASVEVLVPPGVTAGSARAVDAAGNVTIKEQPVKPGHYPRERIWTEAPGASWDRPLAVEVFAIDPSGRPAASPPRLSASRGELGPPEASGPGLFRFAYRAPTDPSGGAAVLTAWSTPDDEPTRVEIALQPGPPARLVVDATPTEIRESHPGPVSISGWVEDGRGNRLGAVPPAAVSTDFGRLLPRAGGATLELPESFEGRRAVQIAVSDQGLESHLQLRLRAAHPYRRWAVIPGAVGGGLVVGGVVVGTLALAAAQAQQAGPAYDQAHAADAMYVGGAISLALAGWLFFHRDE